MIIQFRTMDDALWAADTDHFTWARIDKPAAEPDSIVLEGGKLLPLGFSPLAGQYGLQGRTEKSEGPGGKLNNFVLAVHIGAREFDVVLRANVPTKDFTSVLQIERINFQIAPHPDAPLVPDEVIVPTTENPLASDPRVIDVPNNNDGTFTFTPDPHQEVVEISGTTNGMNGTYERVTDPTLPSENLHKLVGE
jgi:hypothetical protein